MRDWCVCGLCLILAAAGLGLTPGPARAAGGALAFELTWSGTSDFDLAAQEPSGTWLTFNEPESVGGGVLNTDAGNNFCEESGDAPQESATWAEPVEGEYWINVQLYSACGEAEVQPFTLTITVGGQPVERVQGIAVVGEDNTRIFNFVYRAVEWPPLAAGEAAAAPQEGIAGLEGLFGEQGPAGGGRSAP